MRIGLAIILLTSCILFSDCLGGKKTSVATKYYVIEKPDDVTLQKADSSIYSDKYCKLNSVFVYPAFATQKIANRSKSNELNFYSYHQWAVLPGESLTLLAEDYFKQIQLFRGISTRFWGQEPLYELTCTIYQLEVSQLENRFQAHLNLEFTLTNPRTNEVLIRHKADRKEILQEKNLNLFAIEVEEIFYQELKTFSAKILENGSKN